MCYSQREATAIHRDIYILIPSFNSPDCLCLDELI